MGNIINVSQQRMATTIFTDPAGRTLLSTMS